MEVKYRQQKTHYNNKIMKKLVSRMETRSMRCVDAMLPGWAWLELGEPFFDVASGTTETDGEPLGEEARGLIGSVFDSIAL